MLKNKKNNRLWLFLGILILIFFISRSLKPVESLTLTISKPFASFFSETGHWFNQKLSFFSDIGEIKNENQDLVNENLKLKYQLVKLREIETENEIFRKELELKKKSEFDLLASMIIGLDLAGDRKIIYLDKGEEDGLKVGDPLIVGEGILVGQISEANSRSSKAELILDKNIKINAEIQENQIKGIVQGRHGTSANMEMIPQTADLKKGQTVITSGLGGGLPRGLLIGYIEDYQMTVDQLFQTASLKLPVDFKNLRMIWVVKS